MRSISVLILVLAVLGALGYLLFSGEKDAPLDVASGGPTETIEKTPEENAVLTSVDVRTEGALPIRTEREVIPGEPEFDAEVHDSGVTGRVLNEAGEPVEGAAMTLAFADEMFLDVAGTGGPDKPDRHTETDEEGNYKFDNLEPADYYTVIAQHPEFGSGRLTGVKVPYRVYEAQSDLILSIGSALTGNITDVGGNPILGAKVTLGSNLFTRHASRRDWKVGKTDDVGHYVLPDISGGTFTFMVEAEGFATHVLNALPFDGIKPRKRDVKMNFAEGIAGVIVDERGSPIKGARVEAKRHTNSKLLCRDEWTTKADGEFELGHLEAGEYTVLVQADGYVNGRQNLVPTGTNSVTIELMKLATVTGEALGAADGSPLASGSVLLRRVIQGTDITDPTRIKAPIKSGRFTLEGVEAGDYIVEASAIKKGFAPTFSAPFQVVQGSDYSGVVVHVTRGAKVTGLVVDLDGKPVANAQVSTEDRAGYLPGWPTNIIPQKVRTDSAGRFALNALKPETYRINVVAAGFVKWTKQDVIISGSDDQDLGLVTLSRGGTVTGTLIDEFGNPIVGCQVYMRLSDVGSMPRNYHAKSKNGGIYTVPNVQPGNYKVWSMPQGVDGPAPGGKKSEAQVIVHDNQVSTVDLKLDYSNVRTRDGRNPRDPNPKFNPKEPGGRGVTGKGQLRGGGKGGGKGGGRGGRGSQKGGREADKKGREGGQ